MSTVTYLPRSANQRGHTELNWLNSWHSFSFGHYRDPGWLGFGALRVLNDDQVAPAGGFGTHPHNNMEIVSYVISGELAHQDSMGNGSSIRPGDLQRMSAGSGITHSEFNHSETEPVHFLQIWFEPTNLDLAPSYGQQHYPLAERRNQLRLMLSPDGSDGSLTIGQQVWLSGTLLTGDLSHQLTNGERAWVQVIRGDVQLNGHQLSNGDGLGVVGASDLHFSADQETELILIELL